MFERRGCSLIGGAPESDTWTGPRWIGKGLPQYAPCVQRVDPEGRRKYPLPVAISGKGATKIRSSRIRSKS